MGPPSERRAPADRAPSSCEIETTTSTTTYGAQPTGTFQRNDNIVARVRSSRPTWSRSTPPRTKLFAYTKPAIFYAQGLLADGWRVELTYARRGLWHPMEIPESEPVVAIARGCEVCNDTGVILAGLEGLARPCPPCRMVAS